MFQFFEEYAKHSVLNLAQALHGMRYFLSHPDIDRLAPRGSFTHVWCSTRRRAGRIANDLFFAAIPPHWHHSRSELAGMRSVPMSRWFQYGYCAWRFTESGERKAVLAADLDKRWDPRCEENV